MSEQPEVRFGGNTSELDRAANKASQDIKGVGKTAEGLKGTFSSVGAAIKNMFSGTNYTDVATKMRTVRSEVKGLADGASSGSIQLGVLGRTLAEAAATCAPLAAALVGVAVALGGLYAVKKVLEFGEAMGDVALNIQKASQKLGMNAEEIQKWHGVAEQVHMDAAQMDTGFTRLERSMYMAANGGKMQSAAFKELGINVKELKSPSDALIAISEKFKNMDDGPKKTALAMQLMGRAGAQMIPVLNRGKDGLKEMMDTAEATGSVMSNDLVNAGLAVDEQFNQMHLLGTGLKNMFFSALAPAIHAIVSGMVEVGKRMIESYKAGGMVYTMVQALAVTFKVLATVVIAVAGVFITFSEVAVGAVKAVIEIVGTLAKAVSEVFSGVTKGLSDASHGNWADAWNDVKDTGHAVWQDLKGGAQGVGTTLKNSLTGALTSLKGTGHAIAGVWSSHLPKPKDPLAAEDDGMDLSGNGKGGKQKKQKDNSKEIAKKKLEAYLAELDREEAAAEDDYQKKMDIEQKKLDALAAFYGKDSKEYIEELKKKEAMEREHAKKLREIAIERLQHEEELRTIDLNDEHDAAMAKIDTARTVADEKVALGQMSATKRAQIELGFLRQELDETVRHENEMYQVKLTSMRDQLALLPKESDAYRQLNEKIETAERQHVAAMNAIDRKGNAQLLAATNAAVNASVAKWKSIVSPITQAFGGIVNGILTKTQTLKQGLLNAFSSIVGSFVNMGVEMLTNWIATQLGIRAVHAATAATQKATDAASAVAGKVMATTTNVAEILSLAPVAGAGAFAATAAIPIVGPALAPGAAAAAMAAVAAMAPLAVAARGYDIPRGTNPLTRLHEQEMVLPAHIANPLRSVLKGAGPRAMSPLSAMSAAANDQMRSDTALRGSEDVAKMLSAMPSGGGGLSLHGTIIENPRQIERWFRKKSGAAGQAMKVYRRKGGNARSSW